MDNRTCIYNKKRERMSYICLKPVQFEGYDYSRSSKGELTRKKVIRTIEVGEEVEINLTRYSSGFGSPDPNYVSVHYYRSNGDFIGSNWYDLESGLTKKELRQLRREGKFREKPEVEINFEKYFKEQK